MMVTIARGLSNLFPGSCMRPSSLGIDDTFQQTQLFAGWRQRHIQEGPDASGLSDKWKMKNVMIERDGDARKIRSRTSVNGPMTPAAHQDLSTTDVHKNINLPLDQPPLNSKKI